MSENGKYVDGSYYFYAPNKGAAIFFTIAFFGSFLVHTWQTFHYKCWKLTPLYPICCLLFTAGFATRAYGAFHYGNLVVYIVSVCLTYAAPPLLELQNYRILGRVLYYVPYLSPLHPGRVLTTFGFVSAIVEFLNGYGASYSANQSLSSSQIAIGHGLIKASLLLQLVVAASFIALAVTFHRKCRAEGIRNPRLEGPLLTLYISTALITVRTIYRTVEYFSIAQIKYSDPHFNPSSLSPITRYEWFFYVFEATLMLSNSLLLNARHPRRWLPANNKIYLAKDGVTAVEGAGYKDTRPLWRTLLDPFDLAGTIRGNKSGGGQSQFWETEQGAGATRLRSEESANKRGSVTRAV